MVSHTIRRIAVGDIMTRHFSYTKPDSNLLSCAKQMMKERVDSLLVTEGNKLVGIITHKDILWAITKKPGLDLRTVNAIDVATRKVAVIKPSADIAQAFHKMRKYGFRRLPVLSKGEVVGMLTIKDILKIEPSFYMRVNDFLDVREEQQKMQRVSHKDDEGEAFCDNCGAFADLVRVGNQYLCADCREELD